MEPGVDDFVELALVEAVLLSVQLLREHFEPFTAEPQNLPARLHLSFVEDATQPRTSEGAIPSPRGRRSESRDREGKSGPCASRAAVAAGADGLLIEVHPDPEMSWSDGFQTIPTSDFDALLSDLRAVAAAVGKTI